MLGPDELERLSRSLAGDLTPDEARALERELRERPELRQGLEQLQVLDRAAAELSTAPLDERTADRLVRGALGGAAGRGVALRWSGAAALVVGIAVTALVLRSPASQATAAEVIALSGQVQVDGVDLHLSARALRPAELVETGADGAAVLSLPRGTLRLTPLTRVQLDSPDSVQVQRGTVLASADGVGVSGVVVRGDAVISVEPPPGLDRVTDAIWESGGDMTKIQWTRLLPPAAAAVAASGLTVFVLAGRAETAPAGAPVAVVRSGEQWHPGDAAPAPLAVAARPSPLVTASRPSLEAELARVRAERDALMKQRDELLASAKPAGPTAAAAGPGEHEEGDPTERDNPYRASAATLRTRGERGEFVFHAPFPTSGKSSLPESVARELGITPGEQQQVLEAARAFEKRFHDRLVDIYVSEGGDRRSAEPLVAFEVLDLMRRLPHPEGEGDAVKQVSLELAGMAAPAANPSPLLRALRAMAEEEKAYLDALDRILGPARAEALLNAKGLGRSTYSSSSR